MGEVQRLSKARDKSSAAPSAVAPEPAHAPSAHSPAWAAGAMGAPFAIGGVQRKVAIGAANDAYERQADQVAGRVVGGGTVPPGSISAIAPASIGSAAQRQSKPEEKKKEEKPAAAPVQKQPKPDEKKKDEKPATEPVQKQAKSEEKKKEEKPAASPVHRALKPEDKEKDPKAAGAQLQRQPKPEEKKKDEKPAGTAPVQKQAKPEEKKKEEKPAASPVQKRGKPEEKKKDEKTAPVQKQAKPDEKKKDEKPAAAPVQKQAKPEEKKKEEKPAAAPVQKQAKPEEKKKDEKAATAPVQKQSKPEEKKKDDKPAAAPVQKQAKPEEKKKEDKAAPPVQREIRPEDKKKEEVPGTLPIQRAETDQSSKKEDEAVQTSRSGSGGSSAAAAPSMESAAANAIASKGPGEPINSSTRGTLESRMGHDLSGVRVHNDSRAHDAASALNARAFTHQNDIWLGRGESQHNLPLMAHEATHVVQQTGSVHRQLVQRADDKKKAPAGKDGAAAGTVDVGNKEIKIPELQIPDFRTAPPAGKPLTLKKGEHLERPTGDQEQGNVWKSNVKADALGPELAKKPGIKRGKPDSEKGKAEAAGEDGKNKIYFLQIGTTDNYLVGSVEELIPHFVIPRWDSKGKPRPFDVDHMHELQLGGDTGIGNLQLLDASANRSSGGMISYQVRKTISDAVASEVGPGKHWKDAPDPKDVRMEFDVTWDTVTPKLKPKSPNADPSAKWDAGQIRSAEPLKPLKALNATEVNAKHLLGEPTTLLVYPLQTGGKGKPIHPWNAEKGTMPFTDKEWLKGFQPSSVTYKPGEGGTISGTVWPKKKKKELIVAKSVEWKLHDLADQPYTCYIEEGSLLPSMRFAEFRLMSKVGFDETTIDPTRGLVARGKLSPSLPFFRKNLDLDLIAEGDDVTLSKTFSAGDFTLPGPIKVTAASVTLGIGTSGLSVAGDVNFEISRVGEGTVHAQVSTEGGIELQGGFDFDSSLFKPAHVDLSYVHDKFSGKGILGIPAGKVRGIKSGTITVSIDDGAIDAKGSIQPDIPAVEEASLSMHYSEKDGLTIAGDLQLKKNIPGIEGGSIHAEVNKKGDKYTVKASGEATPKIPGINSKLIVSYDDGAFDATVTAGYEKGMLKGSVTVGATNRPVDDSGKPGEAPKGPSDKITVYGGGSVTLKLAPWLQATAGIKFKPNGEVEVTGKIGLPKVLDIFDEKKVEKNIFKIGIDIPVFPGIQLNVGGGLDVNAGIGPGQLQEVEVDVTYNPAHEDETNVHGHAALHIPAHAGLRMNVHAALGVGIPLAKVEGGIELGGSLGVEGALHAAVDIDWTPKKGLVLDASAEIYAEPKFKFDVTGYVDVVVGIGWLSKTLWEKRWELAAVEYGSGLRFGLKLPIHYEEGKPFNVSLSDIQFEVPKVDPMSVIKGLVDKII